jgi:NitT/TauT family transport system substrate-binding protein
VSRSSVSLIVLLSAGVLAGCGSAQPEAAPVLRTVKVNRNSHMTSGPLLLAEDAGYFAEQGLKIEFVDMNRGEESLIALLGGELDVLHGPLHPGLLTAVARGGEIRIVAGLNVLAPEGCTYHAIVLRPGLTPEEAQRGIRRLDASRDGSTRYLAGRMLATRGINIDTLNTLKLPAEVIGHSLGNGSVDAASLSEPLVTRIGRTGTVWLRSHEATPGFQWSVMSFGKKLLRDDPEAGVRFLTAYRRGVALFREGKTPGNLERLERLTQEDRKILEASCWPFFPTDLRPNLSSVLDYQQWALEHDYLDETATLAQLWDSSFVVASDSAFLRHLTIPPGN